ncbi:hypothetical protein D3870_00250 [Noviherbaspirillum cavernae]|uniref:EamA domain-containing protein n=1 Tax=Noviherbaspirillum cavernae TaxID=2320862 RepID=A0A418WWU6_9BURK|nr:hypothetical protein [Noviherbaspirillum cavernae]RJG04657.1 hypothetical protein D3870_00250 [Noviherbaspirillum cavernae]
MRGDVNPGDKRGAQISVAFAWVMVAGMVVSTTLAQILFKSAANHSLHLTGQIGKWMLNPWVWMALLANAFSLVFWMLALKRLPLSVAYPWTALVYLLTPIASALVFRDSLSVGYVGGMLCILAGIFFTTYSVKRAA